MPTLNKPIPQSSDGIALEGGYEPTTDSTGAKELDSVTTANGTTRGPQRVVTSALNGVIGPAASQPTATTAGSDTSWSFASQVRHIFIQNNTSAIVQFAFDAASSVGAPILLPGATFTADLRVTAVHLFTVAIQQINGTAAGNIVVWGWL